MQYYFLIIYIYYLLFIITVQYYSDHLFLTIHVLFISAYLHIKILKLIYGVFLPTREMELEQLRFRREETHHSSAHSCHLPGP